MLFLFTYRVNVAAGLSDMPETSTRWRWGLRLQSGLQSLRLRLSETLSFSLLQKDWKQNITTVNAKPD